MGGFVHLHTHTEYSLLDGETRIKQLVERTKELGMDAVAITDHGAMFGCVDFYKEAVKCGVHPIIGCEVYIADGSRFDKSPSNKYNHLILLCENEIGYNNLIYLVSKGYTDGFYYKPRIDFDLLTEHHEGLIALSACLAGEVPKKLLSGNYDGALAIGKKYRDLFGKDNYFIEIQDHGLKEQEEILPSLIRLARELGVGIVATNDVHYLKKENARYQDVLMCIQTNAFVSDTNRMKFETDEFYLKSPEEMERIFSSVPEALENTVKIADRCKFDFDFNTRHLPKFETPKGVNSEDYLNSLCISGLIKRYGNDADKHKERLDYELSVIKQMGFVDYFLIVWDFIRYAKESGVTVGPGRGSAAGSIVSYCLEITDVDPIKYGLIFERFLNAERVSMPDIDIDFAPEGRQKVIDYVVKRYGEDHVSQIITFGTMKAKQAVRDVARAMGISVKQADLIAKLIPNDFKITLDEALNESDELKRLYNSDDTVYELITISRAIEGLPRHASKHAAGVVITEKPIVNYMPLYVGKDDVITSQYAKNNVEALGLLKMDFLGLRNLTVIENAIKIIEQSKGIKIDIDNISYDIPEVYDVISSGNTDGVFQLESDGMKVFMQELKPSSLEDIIAGISIFRPGPMEQRHNYIHNKNYPEDIKYKHPLLENILNVTYGFMVYQEQVLEIVKTLAGYSLGRADIMRRVISKKDKAQMEVERKNFIYGLDDENGNIIIDGCIRRGIDEQVAISIFDEINDFADYAFNKSHAAAYAVVAYRTAYLKTFYPCEFMAALISSVDSKDKINQYISNCIEMGIDRLPPDINASEEGFSVKDGAIRFGLSAVKNVGKAMIVKLVEERRRNGAFKNFSDFVERMAGEYLNKRAVESLIMCGAFDSLGVYRSQLMQVYESAIESAASDRRSNISGQLNLFDMGDDEADIDITYPNIKEFDIRTKLEMEKEMTGLYFSGHPMDEYREIAEKITPYSVVNITSASEKDENGEYHAKVGGMQDGDNVILCGIITSKKVKTTKKGSKMAFFTLEDTTDSIETIVYPKVYQEYYKNMDTTEAVVVYGTASIRSDEEPKLICDKIEPVSKISVPKFSKIYIRMKDCNAKSANRLRSVVLDFKGDIPIIVYSEHEKKYLSAPKDCYIEGSIVAVEKLKGEYGDNNIALK